MQKQKINDLFIEPVRLGKEAKSKHIVGYDFYEDPYTSIVCLARTGSGKTTVIYRALEACAHKKTKVYIFCSSIHTDPMYAKMTDMLKGKGCDVQAFDDIVDKKGKRNYLQEIVDQLSMDSETKTKKGKLKQSEIKDLKTPFIMTPEIKELLTKGSKTPKNETKEKKSKKIYPENIFIIDDLADLARSNIVSRLLTRSRHLKSKVFISCHYISNLNPTALRQIGYYHIFKNQNEEKINELSNKIGFSFTDDTKHNSKLWNCYNDAITDDYGFLTIDVKRNKLKKNFNEEYIL